MECKTNACIAFQLSILCQLSSSLLLKSFFFLYRVRMVYLNVDSREHLNTSDWSRICHGYDSLSLSLSFPLSLPHPPSLRPEVTIRGWGDVEIRELTLSLSLFLIDTVTQCIGKQLGGKSLHTLERRPWEREGCRSNVLNRQQRSVHTFPPLLRGDMRFPKKTSYEATWRLTTAETYSFIVTGKRLTTGIDSNMLWH